MTPDILAGIRFTFSLSLKAMKTKYRLKTEKTMDVIPADPRIMGPSPAKRTEVTMQKTNKEKETSTVSIAGRVPGGILFRI